MTTHKFAISMLLSALMLVSCSSHSDNSDRLGFEQARHMFESRGPQPGQPLPALSLVDLNGAPVSLTARQASRPLVLVTASLTCNVARAQQSEIDQLAAKLGKGVPVIVVYTIDAHPKGDPCPYTGKEWVPKDNERDNVLVPQPITLAERLELARDYQYRLSSYAPILVDTMDNASWLALGQAPNLGLLISPEGVVLLRQGWFDAAAMQDAVIGQFLPH